LFYKLIEIAAEKINCVEKLLLTLWFAISALSLQFNLKIIKKFSLENTNKQYVYYNFAQATETYKFTFE
jgi:hypothetical protein